MIDPKKINMNQLPKKFIDGAIGAYGKDFFSFATTPQVMKSMAKWMNKQIENYEKQFGPIDMTPPSVVSPIQASDLKKPGEDDK